MYIQHFFQVRQGYYTITLKRNLESCTHTECLRDGVRQKVFMYYETKLS